MGENRQKKFSLPVEKSHIYVVDASNICKQDFLWLIVVEH